MECEVEYICDGEVKHGHDEADVSAKSFGGFYVSCFCYETSKYETHKVQKITYSFSDDGTEELVMEKLESKNVLTARTIVAILFSGGFGLSSLALIGLILLDLNNRKKRKMTDKIIFALDESNTAIVRNPEDDICRK